ncbi:hypothetical protein GXB85_04160 [Cellulomonas sp. APG4]|uniref:hypothetical protein n=1 Tax=Cellulomonas sp. APG4 TaxID=1538656 RepID=UPI00137A5AFC|nr:hypothetical protein [Cellulomonas sp. APG4]NCT90147.1 hypothetical protein [Cellulomonas sp. APG4]
MDLAALIIAGLALLTAALSAVYTKRQADAAEEALALARQEAARYPAPWNLVWVKGDTYGLVNGGDETVYDVTIEFPPHTFTRGDVDSVDRLSAGSTHTFLAAMSSATPHRNVTVSWSRQSDSDERHDWTAPLPAKR